MALSKVKTASIISVACAIYVLSVGLCWSSPKIVIRKSVQLTEKPIQGAKPELLDIHWSSDEENKYDVLEIKDQSGTILYERRYPVDESYTIVSRRIVETTGSEPKEIRLVVTFKEKNDPMLGTPTIILDNINLRNLKPGDDTFLGPDSSLVLQSCDFRLIAGKDTSCRYIVVAGIPAETFQNMQFRYSRNFKFKIPNFSGCYLYAPLLGNYTNNNEDQYMFYFLIAGSKTNYRTYDDGEPAEFVRYVELLKSILFNLDLDSLIRSGNYAGKDLEMLKYCAMPEHGILTNLDSVIMWTAFRTQDTRYIEKTYAQLKSYYKTKPSYVNFYIQRQHNLEEPLLIKGTTVNEIVKRIDGIGRRPNENE